jgi:poly [ADP-ribose] polymerase 2/3/4
MELIFNTSFMQQAMAEMSYDANKLPLGKLSKDTILRGFNVLKQIGDVIGDPATAVQKYRQHGSSQNEILRTLSNQYYTVIPHNFGRNVPPAINTAPLLKREADLVENLIDMKISTEIISASNKNHDVHPVDQQYRSLNLEEATPRKYLDFVCRRCT